MILMGQHARKDEQPNCQMACYEIQVMVSRTGLVIVKGNRAKDSQAPPESGEEEEEKEQLSPAAALAQAAKRRKTGDKPRARPLKRYNSKTSSPSNPPVIEIEALMKVFVLKNTGPLEPATRLTVDKEARKVFQLEDCQQHRMPCADAVFKEFNDIKPKEATGKSNKTLKHMMS